MIFELFCDFLDFFFIYSVDIFFKLFWNFKNFWTFFFVLLLNQVQKSQKYVFEVKKCSKQNSLTKKSNIFKKLLKIQKQVWKVFKKKLKLKKKLKHLKKKNTKKKSKNS